MTTYFDRNRLTARLAISRVAILIATISARAMAEEGATAVTPVQVVGSLEATFGVHPGQRRNHTKGMCAVGEFVATTGAPVLSRSLLFSGARIPVIARYSVAGGHPSAADATRTARGMALEFRLTDGSRQHMTMLKKSFTTASELAAAPKDFLEQRLIERVAKGPVYWDMVIFVEEPGDPDDNPTLAWPEMRKHLREDQFRPAGHGGWNCANGRSGLALSFARLCDFFLKAAHGQIGSSPRQLSAGGDGGTRSARQQRYWARGCLRQGLTDGLLRATSLA
jgi:hypothetical protein